MEIKKNIDKKFFVNWTKKIQNIKSESDFFALCKEAVAFQYQNNKVYRQWCKSLSYNIDNISSVNDIPFLPISFYKSFAVTCFEDYEYEDYFLSSGTSSMQRSRHLVYNKDFYIQNTFSCFSQFFSNIEEYCFICLLPNYLEQEHSSLICMMNAFVEKSKYKNSGFYAHNLKDVVTALRHNEKEGIKTILFGVTYALLDLVENYPDLRIKNTIVFETGGMKGRREELPKTEIHRILTESLGIKNIASEYGMCELFSQAYSLQDGVFLVPKQMQVIVKEINDYKNTLSFGKRGIINIVDLCNIDTCCFIQTEDVGRKLSENSFEIIGRLDHSDIRGCNLMY